MSKFIVRFTIFYTSLYFGVVMYMAWNGEYFTQDYYVPLLEYCLYILASEHPKYNCRYARFLALNLAFTDSLSIIDGYFNLIPDATVYLSIISLSWLITVIVTIILAVRHFKRARQIKKMKSNGTNE